MHRFENNCENESFCPMKFAKCLRGKHTPTYPLKKKALYIYRVIQILRAHTDGCRSRPCLACWPASGPLYSCCFQTLPLLFQFIFRVDGHVHRRTFAKRRRAFTDCDYCYTLVL